MALPARKQIAIWGGVFAVLILVLWALGGTLVPFIAGAAVAYFLDPVADRLERLGMGRTWAVATISVTAVLVVLVALLFAIPAIIVQGQALAEALPGYIAQLQSFVATRLPGRLADADAMRQAFDAAETALREGGPAILNTVLQSSMKVVDFALVLLVTPVVAIYLLLDWDRMVARIDGWLPRQHARVIRRLAGDIDRVLAGFVRGQVTVCLILGAYYGIALALIGLPSGLFVGFLTGLISFIPFVGAIIGGALSVGIALFTFWGDPVWIFATVGIFALGQFIEGNILQPKLVGGSVGLHPVWLLLALSVFGALFGFAGLLIAVPLAAALGVLFRFALEQYLESPLYTGRPRKPRPPAEERLMEVSGE